MNTMTERQTRLTELFTLQTELSELVESLETRSPTLFEELHLVGLRGDIEELCEELGLGE